MQRLRWRSSGCFARYVNTASLEELIGGRPPGPDFALYELQETIEALGMHDAADMLAIMVNGDRLKDISDLPLDLAI